ncbi:hypothetical protein ACNOYE_10350 [Nannocystaceae bacterium ST9]
MLILTIAIDWALRLTMLDAIRSPRCDDGSLLIRPDGSVNGRCMIDGCRFGSKVCWSERIEHCFDDEGLDIGVCLLEDTKCDTVLACAWDFAFCDGEYECLVPALVGCQEGICIEDAA